MFLTFWTPVILAFFLLLISCICMFYFIIHCLVVRRNEKEIFFVLLVFSLKTAGSSRLINDFSGFKDLGF